jgi:hypothetical protein
MLGDTKLQSLAAHEEAISGTLLYFSLAFVDEGNTGPLTPYFFRLLPNSRLLQRLKNQVQV